jgi:hypothetical protein
MHAAHERQALMKGNAMQRIDTERSSPSWIVQVVQPVATGPGAAAARDLPRAGAE